MKTRSILLGILTVVTGLVWGGQSLTVQAKMTNDKILQTAPKGVTIGDYFSTNSVSGSAAKISSTDFGDGQAVNLTTGANQTGVIWASDDARMNLNEDQTASMWMYFGDGRKTGSAGDGMAFVLQNDSNGVNAIAKNADGTPAGGQSMGVWGTDARTDMTQPLDTTAIAKLAIQNSWAVEFDTVANQDISSKTTDANAVSRLKQGPVSAFDWDTEGQQHIASNFPGKSETYKSHKASETTSTTSGPWYNPTTTTTTTNYYYPSMNHLGKITPGTGTSMFTFLDAGWWRHVTMHWDSSKDEMTYSYNDQVPRSGEEATTATSSTDSASKTYTETVKINPADDLDVGADGLVRWGFVGSTGSSTTAIENNIVVFDQVPGLVNGNATATLTDTSQSDKVIDDPSDTVNSGDRLSLNYNLKYTSGRESWKDIVAKLNLPTNIVFKNATIKYANGDTDTISDLDTSSSTGQTLSKSLENLNNEQDGSTAPNATADITLNGVAVAGDNDTTTVNETHSSFEGSNALMHTTVSAFNVKKVNGSMTMALTGDNIAADGLTGSQKLTEAKDVTLTGQITYGPGSTAAANSDITLHPQMNGVNLPTKTLSDSDAAGKFSYTIPASSIISGLTDGNQFVMYATDKNGINSANDVGYTITLKDGTLDLMVNPTGTFNVDHPKNLTGSAMSFPADSNWDVRVKDTRGAGSTWTLTAKADPVSSSTAGLLDGDIVYEGANGDQQSLTAGAAVIATHTDDSDSDEVNVTSGWDSTHGIQLETNAGAISGSYSTYVYWTFENAPVTE
ncbi:L-type lectin family protein [Levilactobacillus tujiorum]|uniref:hypothetical protein n=1 Tax=Levilactobacillus tujiorum TaxID=2912243 RepID=UPI00145783FC|nr:hypothetical protein [Levilactobacillus tujiorum]NLR31806.1 hypothetical protein [Levilactobacillus tujiorum]